MEAEAGGRIAGKIWKAIVSFKNPCEIQWIFKFPNIYYLESQAYPEVAFFNLAGRVLYINASELNYDLYYFGAMDLSPLNSISFLSVIGYGPKEFYILI